MLMYSAGSFDSYHVCVTSRVYACSRGKLLQAAVHTLAQTRTNFQRRALLRSAEFRLLFRALAKGIMFYDVPVSYVKEELRFRCELEPFNARNANSIRLNCPSTLRDRLQLT